MPEPEPIRRCIPPHPPRIQSRIAALSPTRPPRPINNTTLSKHIKTPCAEETYPRREGEPDCVSDGGGSVFDFVDAGFGEEEEDDVEDEGEEGEGAGGAGHACGAACEAHFADVGEEAEEGGDACAAESDDVDEESVGEPFDDDGGDLGEGDVVAE